MRRVQMRKLFLLSTIILISGVSSWAQNPYYVYNGGNLQTVHDDPNRASCASWTIWLFKKGSTQSPLSSYWGVIDGKSVQSVMKQLTSAQNMEKTYDKFFGLGTWGMDTNFNTLGPICLSGTGFMAKPSVLQTINKVSDLNNRMNKVLSTLQPLLKDWDCAGLRESNPCKLYYGDSAIKQQLDGILNAFKQTSKLYGLMSQGLNPSMQQIDLALAQANRTVALSESTAPTISSRLSGGGGVSPSSTDTSWMKDPYPNIQDGGHQTFAENGAGVTINANFTVGIMNGTFFNYVVSFSSIDLIYPPDPTCTTNCSFVLHSNKGFPVTEGGGVNPVNREPVPTRNGLVQDADLYFPNPTVALAAYTYFRSHAKQAKVFGGG